jgi:Predicted Fe-S-cluster oxidoreductase
MSERNDSLTQSDASPLDRSIETVGEVYARIEAEQRAFLASAAAAGAPLRCPSGCGACCEPFVPDITSAEAAYAAAWIIEHDAELARTIAAWHNDEPETPPCPFYRKDNLAAHCSIYPARFLICRLFYASAVRDKEGRASFRPCAHMPLDAFPKRGEDRPSLAGEELARIFGAEPPVMADYAAQIVALLPSESSERLTVAEALPRAIARVGLALSLAQRAEDGDDPLAPAPAPAA